MSRVAIVTDSASDLSPADARAAGVMVVPLIVRFGDETFKAGEELSVEDFWSRMTAPDAPFPTTAAASPGDVKTIYDRAFADGAEAIVSVHVAGTLSGAMKSVQIARDLLPDREIRIVDSRSASMGEGILAKMGAELAGQGVAAEEIARVLDDRAEDLDLYVALDTLEYLKRGGRISGAQAAIGSLLSVKPIITIRHGSVDVVERVRTRSKARERVAELLTARPVERLAVLSTPPGDGVGFRDELLRRLPDLDPGEVSLQVVGPSVGPHLGPDLVGGVVLYRR